MSYIIFIWDFFFFFFKELFLLFFFFFLFSCIACWAKSPILHFRACSVFYFFVGGSFFDREYEEGGDVRGCRHLVFFSYFFFLPWRREYEREKRENDFSLKCHIRLGSEGRTSRYPAFRERERKVHNWKDPLMVLADKISAPTAMPVRANNSHPNLRAHVGHVEQLASLTVFQLRSFFWLVCCLYSCSPMEREYSAPLFFTISFVSHLLSFNTLTRLPPYIYTIVKRREGK